MRDATGSRIADPSPDARAVRSAAALHVVLGAGFGVGTVLALAHLARHGELPMTPWGFRALGGGPFEQLGSVPFTALGWSLVLVSALDVLAGIWLWQGRRRGLRLALATTVPAFGLSVGFALPFLLVGVPIRLALAVAGRRRLR